MGRSLRDRWVVRDDDDLNALHDAKVAAERLAGTNAAEIKIRSRWLLRYVNGDVLAISDFFALKRTDWNNGNPGSRIEPPVEFRMMLRDDTKDVIVTDYDYERISDFDYDNYKALGFPKAVYSQHHGLLVLEQTDDNVP